MGIIRILLAFAVLSHHTVVLDQELLPGTVSVRLFFILSGFYMSLILDGDYRGRGSGCSIPTACCGFSRPISWWRRSRWRWCWRRTHTPSWTAPTCWRPWPPRRARPCGSCCPTWPSWARTRCSCSISTRPSFRSSPPASTARCWGSGCRWCLRPGPSPLSCGSTCWPRCWSGSGADGRRPWPWPAWGCTSGCPRTCPRVKTWPTISSRRSCISFWPGSWPSAGAHARRT